MDYPDDDDIEYFLDPQPSSDKTWSFTLPDHAKIRIPPEYQPYCRTMGLVTKEHLKYCDCQKHEVDKVYKRRLEEAVAEKGGDVSLTISDAISHAEYINSLTEVEERCERDRVRCPYEAQVILETLDVFAKTFPLDNPSISMILKSVCSQVISWHRLQAYSSTNGMLERVYGKEGESRLVLSPAEDLKYKYDKLLVETMEKLNNIMYGQKNLNLNVNANSDDVDLKDFMKQLQEMRNK